MHTVDPDSSIRLDWVVEVVEMPTGIGNRPGEVTPDAAIRIYPNPFSESQEIRYLLPFDARVQIEVYDLTGRKTGILLSKHLAEGIYNLSWDGRDDRGGILAQGVYIIRFVFQGRERIFTQERKVVINRSGANKP